MGVGIRGQCPQTVAPMKICFEHFTKTNISPQTLKPGYGSGVGDKNPVIYRNAEQAHMTVKSDQTYSLGFLLKAMFVCSRCSAIEARCLAATVDCCPSGNATCAVWGSAYSIKSCAIPKLF